MVWRGEGVNKNKLFREFALIFVAFSVVLFVSLIVPRVTALEPFIPLPPTVYSCDDEGNSKNSFDLTEFVYACGDGYNPEEPVIIYVVPQGSDCTAAASIAAIAANANPAASGSLGPVNLGTFDPGEYDIWVDRDNDGSRDPLTEPVDAYCCLVGFFVIPEYWLGTILGLVGCFAALGAFRLSKHKHR